MPPWSKVLTSALSPNGVSRIIGCEEGDQWSETEPNKQDAEIPTEVAS